MTSFHTSRYTKIVIYLVGGVLRNRVRLLVERLHGMLDLVKITGILPEMQNLVQGGLVKDSS